MRNAKGICFCIVSAEYVENICWILKYKSVWVTEFSVLSKQSFSTCYALHVQISHVLTGHLRRVDKSWIRFVCITRNAFCLPLICNEQTNHINLTYFTSFHFIVVFSTCTSWQIVWNRFNY